MDFPGLDFAIGRKFSAEIRDRLRCRVSPSAGSPGFLLLVAFGRCKFKLSDSSVGVILQSVLGGSSSEFHALELEDRVFQFVVHSQAVGFSVYKLGQFSCQCFEASFFLWNSNGLAAARKATTLHQQQSFQWVQVGDRKSYAQAVSSGFQSCDVPSRVVGSVGSRSFYQPCDLTRSNAPLSSSGGARIHRSPRPADRVVIKTCRKKNIVQRVKSHSDSVQK
ncbi:hypothetical protein BS78_01G167300 [Paspalum vaginatum]|nr:hypothetical protein BS78_01G167300 [Paspalum vaginatum]